MIQSILRAISGSSSAFDKSPAQQATTVHLNYTFIRLAGIKNNQQLLQHLKRVAGDLFDQLQAHLANVHAVLPNKESWTKACLAITLYPEFLDTDTLIWIRHIDELGSPHLLLCQAFAEELLRRCPDGTETTKTVGHFLDDPSLPHEERSHCTTHTITVSNGQLLFQG
jgi:hypothetical protein